MTVASFVFVGLGLHDEVDVTLRGMEAARGCDVLYAEFYTSRLLGTSIDRLAERYGQPVRVLSRAEVEEADRLVEAAKEQDVGFLVAGDPMAATTHVDLRLRLHRAGVPTRVVAGVSALTAAAGALGLQAYKFGRTTTLPFREEGYAPTSPYEALAANRAAGLHTLALLDLREERVMTAREGLTTLLELEEEVGGGVFGPDRVACVVGRLGAPDPTLLADRVHALLDRDPGPPLHTLIVPGDLHFLEVEALEAFAGLPRAVAAELNPP